MTSNSYSIVMNLYYASLNLYYQNYINQMNMLYYYPGIGNNTPVPVKQEQLQQISNCSTDDKQKEIKCKPKEKKKKTTNYSKRRILRILKFKKIRYSMKQTKIRMMKNGKTYFLAQKRKVKLPTFRTIPKKLFGVSKD